MTVTTSYKIKIKEYNHLLDDTVKIYRAAVDFFVSVALQHWDQFSVLQWQNQRVNLMEKLTLVSTKRPVVEHPFNIADKRFYKMPSYCRRAAIADALGMVSSYKSNYSNWEKSDPLTRGKEPGVPKAGHTFLALYQDNMFIRTSDYAARIKAFVHNTWDWLDVELRKSDVDYILHYCSDKKEGVPVLYKSGKRWFLRFSYEEQVSLPVEHPLQDTILAVDLGINNPCVCVAMRPDGTVLGRRFLKLPSEYDCLQRSINRIKKSQQHGGRKNTALWAVANGINNDIAVKTARFIIETAKEFNCVTIVMEHLNLQGKKRGSMKQRLHLWKARYVQQMVFCKAHQNGMRASTVNAYNTSKLAFDGSGPVQRGKYVKGDQQVKNYSMCLFTTGKEYNCDLNACYNIGARYYVRAILKSLPATVRCAMEAKVPPLARRSTCTHSTLISLNAELKALAA